MELLGVSVSPRRLESGNRGWREYNGKTRVYVEFKGEELKPFVKKALEKLKAGGGGLELLNTELKARWSQKAGCSCPCSPGFILEATVRVEGTPVDIWMTVGKADEPVKPAEVTAALVGNLF